MATHPAGATGSRAQIWLQLHRRWKSRWRQLPSMGFAVAMGLMRRVTPVGNHVVLCGHPPDEPSIVEMARILVERYEGRIYWIDTPPDAYLEAVGLATHSRLMRIGSRWTRRALWAYLTAEVVFTTHGLYGMPPAPRNKPVVDLWHGEATKAGGPLYPNRRLKSPPSTVMVVSSRTLAQHKLALANMPKHAGLWVGAPRIDQIRRPVSDADLERLGIDPVSPFVLWMPTYRQARVPGTDITWVHTKNPMSDHLLARRYFELVASRLRAVGFNTVVKPHVLDATSRAFPGAVIVTQEALMCAGVPLYSLLGRSVGLVTDYSSVWLDYLTADKPLGFFMPDIGEYDSGEGADVTKAYNFLPGVTLNREAAVEKFIDDLNGSFEGTLLRRNAVDNLCLWTGPNASLELLRQLADRDLFPALNLEE